MIITAHRGAGSLEPENTLRAIQRAIDLGVDQIEVDARLTRDGRVILMHDPTVDRTTNGTGRVADLTLAEIRRLDAGRGEPVPTLEEALAHARGKVVLQIELKGPHTAAAVVRAVAAAGMGDAVILTSFVHRRLREVRLRNPRISTGALWGRPPDDAVQQAQRLGAQALHIWHEHIDHRLVAAAHAPGLLVRAWNANQEEEMRRLIELGVDAIGSDRPDVLLDVCRRLARR
ncbi:MAG: glycerophosphodiester phosphodiesterase family protein [Thermodesulfobacteriota bacterium]